METKLEAPLSRIKIEHDSLCCPNDIVEGRGRNDYQYDGPILLTVPQYHILQIHLKTSVVILEAYPFACAGEY